MNYGPLFRAIRGRRWFLAAHAVQVTKGEAQANVFLTRNGIGVPIVLGAPFSLVSITIRGLEWPANKTVVTVLRPGGSGKGEKVAGSVSAGNSISFDVQLHGHGSALAVLTATATANGRPQGP